MKIKAFCILLVVSLLLVTACCTKKSSVIFTHSEQVFGLYTEGVLHVQVEAESCINYEITKLIADDAWKYLESCLLELSKGQVCDLSEIRRGRAVFKYNDDGSVICSLCVEIPQQWRDA